MRDGVVRETLNQEQKSAFVLFNFIVITWVKLCIIDRDLPVL